MKLVTANVDQMQVFVITSKGGMKIDANANVLINKGICNKWLTWNSSNCECNCDK